MDGSVTTTYIGLDSLSMARISPVDTLWGKYGTNIYLRTEAKQPPIVRSSGFEGKTAPQGLFTYNASSGLLLLIVLLYSYMLFRSGGIVRGTWISLFKKQRERSSIFENEITAPEVRFRVFVRILGVIGLAVFAYTGLADFIPHVDNRMAFLLLGGIAVAIVVYLWLKYAIVSFLSYVFLGNKKAGPFIQTYFAIIMGLGVVILPLVALQTLASAALIPWLQIMCITACIIASILLLYKIVQIFWIDYYSIFYIILYLCTLEILPILVGIRVIQLFDISV